MIVKFISVTIFANYTGTFK